ncbi:hypothetical protein DDZ13_13685 [Coraliomargarita sinensis]|uniref:Sulfotransferase family protein n=2 Tax=Coraliomargarita sinensis TaxID=2174842 RepID=A0A317ZD01_9BACT|nr:hypothetical protein DDZ13_13685 [Coraliomargarita sinensis]
MLISHRYKFIYMKTVKTAGTSTESYFERFCMHEGEWEPLRERDSYESDAGIIGFRGHLGGRKIKWYNHMPAAEVKQHVGDEIWNSYYKFCSIRNPWDKCISAYFHFGKDFNFKPRRRIAQKIRYPLLSKDQHRFLGWLHKGHPPIDRDKYLIEDKPCIDRFIRFENMKEDMKSICEDLGLPWNEDWLPRFRSETRNRSVQPADLYSKPAHALVHKRYAYEIETFNYQYTG